MSKAIKHIAVIRLSAMGDVAMTVPILKAFVKTYPDIKITMVSRPFFQPFFQDLKNVSFFPIDLKQRHNGFIGLFKLYSDLKKLDIDAFADLHQVLRSKVVRSLFAISGKKTAAIDKLRSETKALTRAENKIFKPLPSVFERYAKVFSDLGYPISLENPTFDKATELDAATFNLVGEKSQHWIGIAPFAQHFAKVYPSDLMQTIINSLAKNDNNKIFLFGSKSDLKELNSFAANHNKTIVVTGNLDFKQELALISNLDLMLSMDSANAHIAALYGIKVVTLWGATHPFTGFYPFNQPMKYALMADREKYPQLPTSVYGNKFVAGYEDAMRTISPESVVEKVNELLKN